MFRKPVSTTTKLGESLQRIVMPVLSTVIMHVEEPVESQQASYVYHVACWRTVEVQQARFDYRKACWTPVADYDTSVDYHEAYWVLVEDGAGESVLKACRYLPSPFWVLEM